METDERLTLYRIINQDIRDYKANQWRFSHYGLLIQAALVAVDRIQNKPVPECVLGVLSAAGFVGVLFLIHEAQCQIAQLRPASDCLADPIKESMAEWTNKFGQKRITEFRTFREHREFWARDRHFASLFPIVQFVAMFLAIWVIWSIG